MKRIRVLSGGEAVDKSLRENCAYFFEALGQPAIGAKGQLIFSQQGDVFQDLTVSYRVDEKFLAKFYLMVIEAKFKAGEGPAATGGAELWQPGFLTKETPRFRATKGGAAGSGRLLDLLNAEEEILALCRAIDLEGMTVSYEAEEETWRIHIQPYGGSYLSASFPPMRYRVALPVEQAEAILKVTRLIAGAIDFRWSREGRAATRGALGLARNGSLGVSLSGGGGAVDAEARERSQNKIAVDWLSTGG